MFDAKTIRLAESLRPDLDFSVMGTEQFAILKIVENASGGGVEPIRDAVISNGIAYFDGVTVSQPLVSLKLNIPVTQTGSGTPSPTNIRDFVGVTGAVISRTGKNLFDNIYPDIGTLVKYRQIKVGNGTFTMSSNCPLNSDNAANIFFFGGYVTSGGSTALNGVYNGRSRTFETTDGYVTVGYRMSVALSPVDYNSQIELSSVATAYEPYTGNTYQISFGQTVYSANLDVLNGKLYLIDEIKTIDENSGVVVSSTNNNVYICDDVFNIDEDTESVNCNVYQRAENRSSITGVVNNNPDLSFCCKLGANPTRLLIKDTRFTSTEDYKAWLSTNPVKIAVKLATPIEIDLTPTVINTLIGENVIFADVGDITECKYTRK